MNFNLYIEFIYTYGVEFWHYLALTSPFLVLGLIFGGIIYIWIPLKLVQKWLGEESISSTVKAAFFGVPLPLCSCSVIPTALGLRRSGASKSATSSFVISTPESGADSIAVTYAMMDLPMTIFRPVAAFFSAVMGGTLQIFFNPNDTPISPDKNKENRQGVESNIDSKEENSLSSPQKFKAAISYAFGDLLDDISGWFLFGIVVGAALAAFLPDDIFMQSDPTITRAIFIVVGIPLYLCASATTPIAAALVLKGVSPGAALILLLVGPAISLPNMLVLQKALGTRGVILNVFSVAFVALVFSYVVDWAYSFYSWPTYFRVEESHQHMGLFDHFAAVVLILLLAWSLTRVYFLKTGGHSHSHDHGDHEDHNCCDHKH